MKIKYISNRELLAEIQRSKATFCHFISPHYAAYDVIVDSIEAITEEAVLVALGKRKAEIERAIADEVIFRVMSDVHLPAEEDERRRRRSRSGEWVVKTNFPPFRHYILREGELVEVGRSHWRGDFANGRFSASHGHITDRLARMFMLMVERYSRGGSWRGYCLSEDHQALTQRGWLGIDEITEEDIILSYQDGTLKWSKIKSIFRDHYEGKMFRLTVRGMDALVTPGHKFVTDAGLKEVEHLLEKDRLVWTGAPVEDGAATYDDAFVELVGWFVTEGNFYFEEGRNYGRVTIWQNEGEYAQRIRACLSKLQSKFSECGRLNESGETNVAFHLTKEMCQKILDVAPNKVLSMPFILSLSQAQRELLIDTIIDGDGWRTRSYRRYCQKNKASMDAFLALCAMAGLRASCKHKEITSFGKLTNIYIAVIFSKRFNHTLVERIDMHGAKQNGRGTIGKGKAFHQNQPTIDYNGRVWCVETEYGSFMARRNGTMYLVGNSYNDEMRSHALVQLSQVGLQFDESRSENPFAFYTQIIKNSFRRILNLERRNQDIRDDLLMMSGAQPSYTRQIDNEFEQRDEWQKPSGESSTEAKEKAPPKRRGRKPKVRVE